MAIALVKPSQLVDREFASSICEDCDTKLIIKMSEPLCHIDDSTIQCLWDWNMGVLLVVCPRKWLFIENEILVFLAHVRREKFLFLKHGESEVLRTTVYESIITGSYAWRGNIIPPLFSFLTSPTCRVSFPHSTDNINYMMINYNKARLKNFTDFR